MKRITGVAIVLLVAFVLSTVALAQDDTISLCGTFSGSTNLLPTVSSSFGLNLTLSYSGFTAVSNTNFAAFPTFNATQNFTLEYFWSGFMVASELDLGLVPFALHSWEVYGNMSFADTVTTDGVDGRTLRGYFKADAFILPTLSATSTLYVNMTAGALFASSRSVFDLVPISFTTQKFSITLDFLNLTLGETFSTSGRLGTYIDVLPSLSTTVWLDLSLSSEGFTAKSYTSLSLIPTVSGTQAFTVTYSIKSITFTSKATFDLVPLGFSSEYLKVNVTYQDLSAYGWGKFAPGGPSAGIGFSYSFCTGSN